MKQKKLIICLIITAFFLLCLSSLTFAQGKKVRPSLAASVTQRIGVDTDITINYSRPGVKGRVIWGGLEPYGMHEGNKYSKDKPFPWRAGANENTTIEFTKDVEINGNKLPAGKYGIHMIVSKTEWTVMFNKDNANWGSYSYNKENDALRIMVKPVETSFQEWLIYGFENLAGTSATAFLHWEKLKIPFEIKVTGE